MVVVGSGDIASVLPDTDRFLFFASGVSNSQEKRDDEYLREKDLLLQQDRREHLVYFGSLSIFYGAGRYVQHKRSMERLVKSQFKCNTIVRLGNIAWGTNPHTIINHLQNQVDQGETVDIQDTERYVVDLPEFLHWIDKIPPWNCEMNIPGRRLTIKEIYEQYVTIPPTEV